MSAARCPACGQLLPPERHTWTQSDHDVLRAGAGVVSSRVLAARLGVRQSQVRAMAWKLGLALRTPRIPPEHSCEVVGCRRPAPGTTLCDMHRKRVSRHGEPGTPDLIPPRRREWTADEEDTIRTTAGTLPASEIAASLGVPLSALRSKASTIGISLRVPVRSASASTVVRRRGLE